MTCIAVMLYTLVFVVVVGGGVGDGGGGGSGGVLVVVITWHIVLDVVTNQTEASFFSRLISGHLLQ
jgi:hypothetical protein